MLQNLSIGLRKRQSGKSDVPVKQRWRLAKKYPKIQEKNEAAFFSPSVNRCLLASNLKLGGKEFVVFGASMHMISKKDLNSAKLETVTTSRSPTTVITTVEKFRRMKRPQFMSKNWIYSWRWKSSRIRQQFHRLESFAMNTDTHTSGSTVKNHISLKMVFSIQCNTENFVPIVVPGLSTSSSSSFPSSTSMTPSRQEIDYPTSSSPTVTVSSDSGTGAREDLCGIDSYPVALSSKHVERKELGDLLTQPTKNPKTK